MRCPRCLGMEDKVIESRTLADGTSIRRRRECSNCGYRYTSYERVEERPLMVVKSQGGREPFDRSKLERGIRQAIRKRPVSQDQIDEILNEIEDESMELSKSSHEIPSHRLGEMVLTKLYELDRVAYVRFASVYRNFENVEEFINEIERLKQQKENSSRGSASA
ncbi:MAG: transcriptional regulator NrdR [Spirochaetota bacterium]